MSHSESRWVPCPGADRGVPLEVGPRNYGNKLETLNFVSFFISGTLHLSLQRSKSSPFFLVSGQKVLKRVNTLKHFVYLLYSGRRSFKFRKKEIINGQDEFTVDGLHVYQFRSTCTKGE